MDIVHSAIMGEGYIEVLPTEMGDGTDLLRVEKPHTTGQYN